MDMSNLYFPPHTHKYTHILIFFCSLSQAAAHFYSFYVTVSREETQINHKIPIDYNLGFSLSLLLTSLYADTISKSFFLIFFHGYQCMSSPVQETQEDILIYI